MIYPKTKEEIEIMRKGGKILACVKEELTYGIKPGVAPKDLDKQAEDLIVKLGGLPSFKEVPGYKNATCININEGVVHGIPSTIPLKEGDLVSIDIGVFYKGFHTDSAFTVVVGKPTAKQARFLESGRNALKEAIKQAQKGNRISDISKAINRVITQYGYSPVRDLTGHGVGRRLHEEPLIPCFWDGRQPPGEIIPEGATLAIEVIYTAGSPDLVLEDDGWTISTKDGKIAGLFEETVAVCDGLPHVLTSQHKW